MQTHTHPQKHRVTQSNIHGLTQTGCAAHQWHPQHSPQSLGETGSDWLILSTGIGSQIVPHWSPSHKPRKSKVEVVCNSEKGCECSSICD